VFLKTKPFDSKNQISVTKKGQK